MPNPPLNPIQNFRLRRMGDLKSLMKHFDTHGEQYPSISALMADMLDDVIDVWLDHHLGSNDDCESEAAQAVRWERDS